MTIILTAFLLTFCAAAFADTIYLNNGSSYEGKVLRIDGDLVTIKTLQSTFTINKYKIKKIERNKEEDRKMDEKEPIGPGAPQWDSNWE